MKLSLDKKHIDVMKGAFSFFVNTYKPAGKMYIEVTDGKFVIFYICSAGAVVYSNDLVGESHPGKISLDADAFMSIIKMSSGLVMNTAKNGLKISFSNSSYTVPYSTDFMNGIVAQKVDGTKLCQQDRDYISLASKYLSSEHIIQSLSSVCMKGGYVIGSDGKICCVGYGDSELHDLLIPDNVIKLISLLPSGDISINRSDTGITMSIENLYVLHAIKGDEYPYDSILQYIVEYDDCTTSISFNPSDMTSAISRICSLFSGETIPVKFNSIGEELLLSVAEQSMTCEEKVPISILDIDKQVDVVIDARLLKKILAGMNSECQMKCSDDNKIIYFFDTYQLIFLINLSYSK